LRSGRRDRETQSDHEQPGQPARTYVHNPGGAPLSLQAGGSTVLYEPDPFGNTAELTGLDGAVQRQFTMTDPFGGFSETTPGGAGAPAARLGFDGQFQDPTTGDYDLRARDYNTTLGRFVSVDPVRSQLSTPAEAPYVYAHDNPLTGNDPTGRMPWIDDGAGCVGSVKACENMEHLKEAADAAAAAAQVGTLSDPNKSVQNDRVLSTKDGSTFRITGDGKTADEYMTMEYLNEQLKAEGKFSHDGAENGWEYLPVRAQPKIGRMPDLVRVQWLQGRIVNVTRVDLIIRDSDSTSVDQLKDKAGQTGRARQADEVVVRLKGGGSADAQAHATAEAAESEGVALNSVRFVSLDTNDPLDVSKDLTAPGRPVTRNAMPESYTRPPPPVKSGGGSGVFIDEDGRVHGPGGGVRNPGKGGGEDPLDPEDPIDPFIDPIP